MNDDNYNPFIWFLVGNIIPQGTYVDGEHTITFEGTKYFKSSAKVYCSPYIWGDGYERIRVIGRARDTMKFISVIMESKWITNWRRQKVYTPYVLRRNEMELDQWDDTDRSKEMIEEMLTWLPSRTIRS